MLSTRYSDRAAMYYLLMCAFLGLAVSLPLGDDPPKWSDSYVVRGVLRLPYAEINEDFVGYYDSSNKRSRIDYYTEMVKTYQRGDEGTYGASYKVAPVTTYSAQNNFMCFKVAGESDAPVTVQAALPDLTGFKKRSQPEKVNGEEIEVWDMVNTVGTKKNVYTMRVVNGDKLRPVSYEMMGFDSLLGSHYDKYVIDYYDYLIGSIDEKMFVTPANITCGDFPGPGQAEHKVLSNPMHEYINHNDEHVEEMFQKFKTKHAPEYKSVKEHEQRKHNFRQNIRFIHSKNRQGLSYTVSVNHLADKSSDELTLMNGLRHTPGDHGAEVFDKSTIDPATVPDTLDWRIIGAVTPVKDQGVCGSCWSFGTAGTIEGAYFLKTKNLVRLSQQQLMDCSWGEGNNGCDGGEDFRSYTYLMKQGGLTSEEQYGQYLAQDGYCHQDKVTPIAKLKGYVNVKSGDQEALQFAISNFGPISVGIDASHKSLSFYANGVYYEPKCGNTPNDLDHAVLAVGYGELYGQKYWLIKNSWSTYWGNDGYVLMSQKDNNCGVATDASYVILE